MAPVKTGYGNSNGEITERHLNFYASRAKFLGALTPEPLFLDKGLRELPTQIGIDSDDKILGLKKLSDLVHGYKTQLIAHLNHPGRMANPKIPGNYFWSSSAQACESGGAVPKEMDHEDRKFVLNLFREAAIRAEKSGFDILELQFGHGYLAAQYISPKVNQRMDEYGGSFENRIRFPLEILATVQSVAKLPIIVRLSGDEMVEGGIQLEEMIRFSKILQEKGVDAIHVSAGTVCSTPPWFFQHMFVPKGKTWELAEKIKEEVDIPIIFVGQINEFSDVNKLLREYRADFIALGRPLLADSDFVGKYLGEIKGNLRPCLACSEGCLGGVRSGKGLGCSVNPSVGREPERFEKAPVSKQLAVVGGGLAGMQAAIMLHDRGHHVSLFEKDKLGGQFLLAPLPPHKESLGKIIDYFKQEIIDRDIEVQQREATPERLEQFDEIVLATGSKPFIPPITGLKEYYWAEVLESQHLPENKRVLVVGGGLIGTEVAMKLLSKGNTVFLVEMMEEIARGMEMMEQKLTLKALQHERVNIFLNTKIETIDNRKVLLEGKDHKQTLDNIDVVVLATGMKSYHPFEPSDFNKPAHFIGDALKIGKAQDAIHDAYDLARSI